ncbi:hypothetical protein C5B77_23240 [Aeromonas salmonicida]|nr:hypothetical protein C5B77_23240 [Aeromonas salmonicida]
MFCLATNQIAQTGLSSLPPVIYYSEQLFRGFNYQVSDQQRTYQAGALRDPTSAVPVLGEFVG